MTFAKKAFITELQKGGYDFTFDIIDGKDHCDLTDDMKIKFAEYITTAIERYYC